MANYKIIGGDGSQYGPVTSEQLQQWMLQGRVTPQTSAQLEGTADWKPLSMHPEWQAPAFPPQLAPPAGFAAPPLGAHQLSEFPVAVVVLLQIFTCGLFSHIWFNLMHGKLPQTRPDDPSAGKAIGFLFIPFYNFYWVFFTYLRLCERLDAERVRHGLPPKNFRGLAITTCIFMIIPYVNIVIGGQIMEPIFFGMLQSSVNELVAASRNPAQARS